MVVADYDYGKRNRAATECYRISACGDGQRGRGAESVETDVTQIPVQGTLNTRGARGRGRGCQRAKA